MREHSVPGGKKLRQECLQFKKTICRLFRYEKGISKMIRPFHFHYSSVFLSPELRCSRKAKNSAAIFLRSGLSLR